MDEEFQSEIPTESVDTRPIIERIVDKNWKTRNTAYEDLKTELLSQSNDNSTDDYGQFLSKMTADANAGAMDSGFDTAIVFVDQAPTNIVLQYSDGLFKNAVEKAFNARATTVLKGKQLLLKMMEVDEPTSCVTYLITKLSDKKPKVPTTCLEVIREGVIMFGLRSFPVKEIVKSLKSIFDGSNAPAKEAGMALIVEIYRWIGLAPLQALLDSIKPVQKVEFEKIISEKEEEFSRTPTVPTVYLRKSRPLPGSVDVAAESGSSKNAKKSASIGAVGMDGREFVDEVDLPKKLRQTDFATLVAEEKWSEQLKGLQLVIDAIGPVPKIKAGSDVHDIVAVCKGFLRQGHVLLQVSSLKILALLADGLRSDFSSTVRPMLQTVLQKSKEKRLVPEVQACLHVVLSHCVSFDSLTDEVVELVRNKKNPPHSKIGMMEFLCTVLAEMPEKVGGDSMKPLAEALISICEDPDPKVRDSCAVTLAALAPIVKSRGKAAVEAHRALMALEQSTPRVFKKMQVAMEGTGSATEGGGGSGKISSAKLSSSSSAVVLEDTDAPLKPKSSLAGPTKKPSATVGAAASSGISKSTSTFSSTNPVKKTLTGGVSSSMSSTSTGASKKSSSSAAKESAEDDNVEDLSMSPEDAVAMLEGLGVEGWDSAIQTNMTSSKWQDKVDALGAIERRIVQTKTGGQYSAALVKYLSVQTGGFKISNANILKAVIQTACAAATNCGDAKFSKPAAWELLRQFGDKLSDRKTKEVVETLLTALGENISPSFVVKRMRVVMDKIKSPVAHQYFLEWLKQAVQDFGCSVFPVPQVGAFCQLEMDNKIAAVRSAAVEVMGALYHQIGPKLLVIAISDDMKPALKALLEAEFAKVGHDPAAAAKATRAVNGEDGGAGAGVAIPRQDLSALVDRNILAELNLLEGKTSWMNRKAAMEALTAACERSGHYLEANKNTGEIVKALKVRIADTQANLKPLAVNAIGHIVASLELESANKVLKIIASGLMTGLADNKKSMRDATVAAIHLAVTFNRQPQESALADTLMLASLLPSICESLANVVGRQELLAWLVQNAESLKNDCGDLTASLVLALQDKTAAVRALSEQLLTNLMSRSLISKVQLDKATRDLPPATKRGLDKTIAALMVCFGTASANAKKAHPAAVVAVDIDEFSAAGEEEEEDENRMEVEEEEEEEFLEPVVIVEPAPVVRQHTSSFRHHPELVSHRPGEAASEFSLPVKRSGLVPPRAGSAKLLTTVSAPDTSHTIASHQMIHKAHVPVVVVSAAASTADAEEEVEEGDARWFLKRSSNKLRRLEEFPRLNWPQPPEVPMDHEMAALRSVWEPLLTSDLAYIVFPKKSCSDLAQDEFVNAISEVRSQMDCPYFNQHIDFILRWCCYILCLRETTIGLLSVLNLVGDIFRAIRRDNPHEVTDLLHESEISSILPHIIDRCGHQASRPRLAFQLAIGAASEIVSPVKITKLLLSGLRSSNKHSRVICIEELQKVIQGVGLSTMQKGNMREIASFLDSKQCDSAGFSAALNLIFLMYKHLGCDYARVSRLLGDMSEGTASRVESTVRDKAKFTAHPPVGGVEDTISPTQSTKLHVKPSPAPIVNRSTVSADHAQLLQRIEDVMTSTPIKPTPSKGPFVPLPTGKGANDKFSSPSAKASRQSMIPIASPGGVSGEFESLYLDIGRKMDRLLHSSGVLSDNDVVHEEAKDYIKMLHSVVSGEWSRVEERSADDDRVLLSHADDLARQLVQCVARSFDQPAAMLNKVPGTFLGIDVSLVAISLSTLFAMVRRADISRQLSEDTIFDIFYECLLRLCDPRILHPHTSDAESLQTAQQIVTAINMVVVKLAVEGHTSSILCVLLRVMFQCIPTSEVSLHVAKSRREVRPLPSACTKPTSRLVIKVLTDETEKDAPYAGDADSPFDTKALLLTIHQFFSQHPANTTDDTPFRTVKTVLNELIKARGGQQVLSALQECEEIGQTAFIYLLTSRLGNVKLSTETDGHLHAQIVAVIDNITHVRDKRTAIRELHSLKIAHPALDFNVYLNQISSTFRRFVLDTLAQLDAGESGDGDFPVDEWTDPPAHETRTEGDFRSQQGDGGGSSSGATQNKADEAMRILEGLKSRPNYYKQLHSAGGGGGDSEDGRGEDQLSSTGWEGSALTSNKSNGSGRKSLDSPFAKRNDKIRNSLSSLTASLDLPSPAGGTAEGGVSSPSLFDSDLSARLQRLRNMDMKT